MTLQYDTIEGVERTTDHQSSERDTITNNGSYTGNYERRLSIRMRGAISLVTEYNTLVREIIKRGTISTREKQILLSMEQEGIEIGGEFFGKIQENEGSHTIPHSTGIDAFNSSSGKTDILQGETRLYLWSLVK